MIVSHLKKFAFINPQEFFFYVTTIGNILLKVFLNLKIDDLLVQKMSPYACNYYLLLRVLRSQFYLLNSLLSTCLVQFWT